MSNEAEGRPTPQTSVELSIGQTGKVGCTVKVYCDDEGLAYERARQVLRAFELDRDDQKTGFTL